MACSRLTLANARLRRGASLLKSPEAAIFRSDVTGIVDEFVIEDEPLLTARANAEQIGGCVPVAPLTGTVLRFLAAAISAKAVVEIGTGCGTSGIWLLRGMRPGSVLTSVDLEPEHHRLSRSVFAAAGFGSSRYRLITGRALEVLPRLAGDPGVRQRLAGRRWHHRRPQRPGPGIGRRTARTCLRQREPGAHVAADR